MKKFKINIWVIVFLILFLAHFFLNIHTNDDIYFSNIKLNDLLPYLNMRYNVWTSRLFIEVILIVLLKLPSIVWFLLDSLVIELIMYCISYLFTKNRKTDQLLVISLVLLYPLYEMSGAGWYATTLNYIWPFAFGLFSFIPIKNAINGKHEKKYMYPLYSISLLFACNQEQVCALVLGFYFVMSIYCYKKKCLNKFIIFQLLLSLISILFIFTCPGNAARTLSETKTWYPEFKKFSFIQKVVLGIVSTISTIISKLSFPYFAFILLLPVLLKKSNIILRINAFIPLLIVSILNIFKDVFSQLFPYLSVYVDKYKMFTSNIPVIDLKSNITIFTLFIGFIIILSSVISLHFIFKDKVNFKKYLIPLILLAGFATRFIMGLSPTIFASGERTYMCFQFCIIIIISSCLCNCLSEKQKNSLFYVVLFFGLLQLLNTIIVS